MATCPLCLFANPPTSTVCTRCGKFRFPNPAEAAALEGVPASEMRTRIVAEIESEIAAGENSRKTVRGPMTVPLSNPKSKSAIRSALSTVKATLVSDSDAYSVVSVDTPLPPPAAPRLVVVRGEVLDVEFCLYDGKNTIGRASEKPVEIDLTGQESSDQVWSSRQHAVVTLDRGTLLIEDLNSLNGTFVNRSRLHPGQRRVLQSGDIVQVGTVQFRVEM